MAQIVLHDVRDTAKLMIAYQIWRQDKIQALAYIDTLESKALALDETGVEKNAFFESTIIHSISGGSL